MDRVPEIAKHFAQIYYYTHRPHEEALPHQAVRLLQHLEMRGALTVGELAGLLGVNHNTASEHVKRLQKDSLLTKERDRSDERKVFVKLTEEGLAKLHRHSRPDEERLKAVLERMKTEEREAVARAFARIAEEAQECFSS
ncbi:MarR family winged helix-turn-helix transcriptional regulator [Paenibacillus thermotolerans]|uniref:MarR family winged helix-turn-helix transcriptional regulator n=1 Tax=Paenibacillus thermotolerans TaxID=3027807 RepID=UPI002367BDB1|nr:MULTISPECIES: MarR family transcriptional regulator [unclassified Paenibacillus]